MDGRRDGWVDEDASDGRLLQWSKGLLLLLLAVKRERSELIHSSSEQAEPTIDRDKQWKRKGQDSSPGFILYT